MKSIDNTLATTPGNPARSKWSSDEAISDGPADNGPAVAYRMGEARQRLRQLPLWPRHGHNAEASALRELSLK